MRIVMLCGPPGAGKSTYVANNRGPEDCQVDMDLIPGNYPQAIRRQSRKQLLLRAAASPSIGTCWFSTAAPTRQQRAYWRQWVPVSQTIMFVPPMELSLERQVSRDGETRLTGMIPLWYENYMPPDESEPNVVFFDYGA